MEHVRMLIAGQEVVLRDMEEPDIDVIVSYWHDASEDFLRAMAVDLSKITTRDAMAKKFEQSLDAAPAGGTRTVFVAESHDELIGYTNLNFSSERAAVAHVHVLQPTSRGVGIASGLFEPCVRMFFERFQLEELVFQTSPTNVAINALLTKFGLSGQLRHLEKPDGMAKPGDFLVYELTPENLP